MMRTTSKAFKEQVQEYIINGLSDDNQTELKSKLEDVVSDFHSWYSPYEQKRTPNRQEAFKEFLNCLPSSIHTEYTHYRINQTLKSWFENNGETYKDKPTDKELDLHHHLVYRELNTLLKQNNLTLF
jgi:hypothetical protein